MSYLDLAARGKTSFWRYLVTWPVAFILAILLIVIVILPLVLLQVLPREFAEQMQSPAHPLPFYLGAGLSFGAVLVGFAVAIALFQKKAPGDIVGDWRWSRFATGAVVWLVLLVVGCLIDYVLRPQGFVWTADSISLPVVLAAVVGLAVQTFAEEFIFRGYMTQAFLHWVKRPVVASVLSGLLFGVFHIPNGIPQAVAATMFGMASAYVAIRTGSLAATYGIHLVNNVFAAIVVVSTDDIFHGAPALWSQQTPELLWGDVAFEVVALAVVLFVFARRKKTSVDFTD